MDPHFPLQPNQESLLCSCWLRNISCLSLFQTTYVFCQKNGPSRENSKQLQTKCKPMLSETMSCIYSPSACFAQYNMFCVYLVTPQALYPARICGIMNESETVKRLRIAVHPDFCFKAGQWWAYTDILLSINIFNMPCYTCQQFGGYGCYYSSLFCKRIATIQSFKQTHTHRYKSFVFIHNWYNPMETLPQ